MIIDLGGAYTRNLLEAQYARTFDRHSSRITSQASSSETGRYSTLATRPPSSHYSIFSTLGPEHHHPIFQRLPIWFTVSTASLAKVG